MVAPTALLIKLPGIPPGANDLHRMNRWGVASTRLEWKRTTVYATLEALRRTGWQPLAGKTHVNAAFHYPDKRRRDPDNAVAGLKPILDGLVGAGALKDDDFGHVILTVEASFGEKEAATWITLEPEA